MGGLDHSLTIPLNLPLGKGASYLRIPTISWVRKRIYSLRQVLKWVFVLRPPVEPVAPVVPVAPVAPVVVVVPVAPERECYPPLLFLADFLQEFTEDLVLDFCILPVPSHDVLLSVPADTYLGASAPWPSETCLAVTGSFGPFPRSAHS